MGNHRIVLIDDSEADVLLLKMCLDDIAPGHELIVLKDGEAALQFIDAERKGTIPLPCVVVLDIHLPKYDGLEILEAIRRTPVLEHVKALIVSTNPTPDQRRKIEEFGVPYAERPNSLEKCQDFARKIWGICESKDEMAA